MSQFINLFNKIINENNVIYNVWEKYIHLLYEYEILKKVQAMY